ncbi:MAG: MltR family transcriptional regulator [Rhodospirillaceae bacterium]|nr:MltR family transcriptional regulator [Rhodospirillaceae bacterium]
MKSANRKIKKGSLKNLSGGAPTDEEHAAVLKILVKGPQMVTVILGSALVEHEIENLLLQVLKNKDSNILDELTNADGPISTFSQKILLGYALGLFDKKVMNAMKAIKKIRNAFAHARKILKLDDPIIVSELSRVEFPATEKELLRTAFDDPSERKIIWAYATLCVDLIGELMGKKYKMRLIELNELKSEVKRVERKLSKLIPENTG